MDKLKIFLIYILIIIGFFILSNFLSGQLLNQMYVKLNGTVDGEFNYKGKKTALNIEILDAKATRMNGYITACVTNNTDKKIDKAYLKTDMFANQNIKAVSRYMEITNLEPGESKNYTLKFRARCVDNYKVAISPNFPDEKYIFELFGYEFNTKDFWGLDISDYIDARCNKESRI